MAKRTNAKFVLCMFSEIICDIFMYVKVEIQNCFDSLGLWGNTCFSY